MKGKLLALVAACLLFHILGVAANAAQVDEQSTWVSNEAPSIQAEVDRSGKQTIIFVIDQNDCPTCGRLLQELIYAQGRHQNVEFRTDTPEELGIPKALLPYVLVITPKCGITRRMPNYSPSNAEAIDFLVKHINNGAALQPVTRTCK